MHSINDRAKVVQPNQIDRLTKLKVQLTQQAIINEFLLHPTPPQIIVNNPPHITISPSPSPHGKYRTITPIEKSQLPYYVDIYLQCLDFPSNNFPVKVISTFQKVFRIPNFFLTFHNLSSTQQSGVSCNRTMVNKLFVSLNGVNLIVLLYEDKLMNRIQVYMRINRANEDISSQNDGHKSNTCVVLGNKSKRLF